MALVPDSQHALAPAPPRARRDMAIRGHIGRRPVDRDGRVRVRSRWRRCGRTSAGVSPWTARHRLGDPPHGMSPRGDAMTEAQDLGAIAAGPKVGRGQSRDAVKLTLSSVTAVNRIVREPADTVWPGAPETFRSWTKRVARPARIS